MTDIRRELDLQKMIDAGALIVDVREPDEYADEHYPSAVNIPGSQTEARIDEFGDGPVILYCISGARSRPVETLLRNRGVEVVNAGGIWDLPGYTPRTPRPSCGS